MLKVYSFADNSIYTANDKRSVKEVRSIKWHRNTSLQLSNRDNLQAKDI